jgi:hypothetical protein
MVEEYLWKVIASHKRDWDARLPTYLLAYRASTHSTMGLTPANLVFWRELRLSCDPLFCAPPDKEQPTIKNATDLMDWSHDIHSYTHQHLKLASNRIKTSYDHLANSAGYQEGDQLWLYHPTCTKGESPMLQPSWESPYRVSPKSMIYTGFSNTLKQRWWEYTWTS